MSPAAECGNRHAPLPPRAPIAAPREQAHAGARVRSGSGTMRVRAVLLATALVLAPLGARAADLVVWWEEGFYPEEDEATREMMAAFEKKTGHTVELTFLPEEALPDRLQAALDAGQPPDFEFGTTATLLL